MEAGAREYLKTFAFENTSRISLNYKLVSAERKGGEMCTRNQINDKQTYKELTATKRQQIQKTKKHLHHFLWEVG